MNKVFFLLFFLCFTITKAQEYHIESIAIKGLKKSKESYIKKLLSVNRNSPIDSLILAEDMIRLIREPAISHAYYTLKEDGNKSAQLTIHIEENKTFIPALDLWQTLEQQLAYHLGATDHNFFGRGYTIGAFYRRNNFSGYGFILENNNFIKANQELKFIAQQRETLEPIQQEQLEALYRYRIQSVETSFGKEINLKHKVLLGIGLLVERYFYKKGDVLNNVPEKFITTKFIAKVGYNYDAIVPFYYFNSGWSNQFTFNHVWGKTIQDNSAFYAFENQTTYFKRIKDQGNLALRLKLGFAKNINTPFPPFAIDNNQNVRGSGNLIQRGSALWVFNNEYRYRLVEKKWFALQANFFIDVAGIRPSGDRLNDIFQKNNIYSHSGIGLRLIHKYIYNAVLRIDYGFSIGNTNRQGIVFGIGQYF